MLDELSEAMPFARAAGVELVSAAPEEVRARLAWTAERCTAGGILHGGALMTLADSAGGLCAYLNLPDGATTATVESQTNFLRPVPAGSVEAVARPVNVGRRLILVQTELRDGDGRLVALTTQTQAVVTPPS